MDFKNLVLNDTEYKYLSMINHNASHPFGNDAKVLDSESYSLCRDMYIERLDSEKTEFNNAIETIKSTYKRRVELEKSHRIEKILNKQAMFPFFAILGAAFLLMIIFVFALLANGAHDWVRETFIPAAGFRHFFDPEGIGKGAFWTAVVITGICAIVAIIIAIVMGVKDGDSDFIWGIVGGIFLGGGIVAGLAFLVIRALIAIISYLTFVILSPFLTLVIGGVGAFFVIRLGKKFTLPEYKKIAYIGYGAIAFITLLGFICSIAVI